MPPRPDANPALATYAVHDDRCRGRVHQRAAADNESPFELDQYRILNSTSFRRLMHKTQVFVAGHGDHFRTRLTHTLEVASLARRLARLLRVNDILAGGCALAHDLGHPPFGHAGESALADLMREHGGFEHNLQSLRVVEYLEHPFPAFRGLNLTFELRESLVKHHTRYDHPGEGAAGDSSWKAAGLEKNIRSLLETGPRPPLEGQIANIADAMAYTLHDVEDGLGNGLLEEGSLGDCRLWRLAADPIRRKYGGEPLAAVRRPILDNLAKRLIDDVVGETRRRLAAAKIVSVEDVRRCKSELVGFSTQTQPLVQELQDLLLLRVYRHHRVVRMDVRARRLIRELFTAYVEDPRLLPERYSERVPVQGLQRVVCDYLAGMTDRFCRQEHRQICAPFNFD